MRPCLLLSARMSHPLKLYSVTTVKDATRLEGTHNFKDLVYNASFVPLGAPTTETYHGTTLSFRLPSEPLCDVESSSAVTVGAHVHGVLSMTLFMSRVVVGGDYYTVGAAGGGVR